MLCWRSVCSLAQASCLRFIQAMQKVMKKVAAAAAHLGISMPTASHVHVALQPCSYFPCLCAQVLACQCQHGSHLGASLLHNCWCCLQAASLAHAPGLLTTVRSRQSRDAACLRMPGVIVRDAFAVMALIGGRSVGPNIVSTIHRQLERREISSAHLALAHLLVAQVRPCFCLSCKS